MYATGVEQICGHVRKPLFKSHDRVGLQLVAPSSLILQAKTTGDQKDSIALPLYTNRMIAACELGTSNANVRSCLVQDV